MAEKKTSFNRMEVREIARKAFMWGVVSQCPANPETGEIRTNKGQTLEEMSQSLDVLDMWENFASEFDPVDDADILTEEDVVEILDRKRDLDS